MGYFDNLVLLSNTLTQEATDQMDDTKDLASKMEVTIHALKGMKEDVMDEILDMNEAIEDADGDEEAIAEAK